MNEGLGLGSVYAIEAMMTLECKLAHPMYRDEVAVDVVARNMNSDGVELRGETPVAEWLHIKARGHIDRVVINPSVRYQHRVFAQFFVDDEPPVTLPLSPSLSQIHFAALEDALPGLLTEQCAIDLGLLQPLRLVR